MKKGVLLWTLSVITSLPINGATIRNISKKDLVIISYDGSTFAMPFIALGKMEHEVNANACCILRTGENVFTEIEGEKGQYNVHYKKEQERLYQFTNLTPNTSIIFQSNNKITVISDADITINFKKNINGKPTTIKTKTIKAGKHWYKSPNLFG